MFEMSVDKTTERIVQEETVEEDVSPSTANPPGLTALNPHSRVFENIRLCSEVFENVLYRARKVDVRLPGKGNSNSHGARPAR